MAKTKKTRTLTISDEVFNGLKTIALVKGTSVSFIVEDLGKKYIADTRADLKEFFQRKVHDLEQETAKDADNHKI